MLVGLEAVDGDGQATMIALRVVSSSRTEAISARSLSMLALKLAAERSPIVEMAMVDRRLVEGV